MPLKVMDAFTEKWEHAPVDLSFLHMCLDASEAALKMKFGKEPVTKEMVIDFGKTVIELARDK